jgi:hypothetical protein
LADEERVPYFVEQRRRAAGLHFCHAPRGGEVLGGVGAGGLGVSEVASPTSIGMVPKFVEKGQ